MKALTNFKSIMDLLETFPTEQSCIDFLERTRWKDGVITSPFSPESKIYICSPSKIKTKGETYLMPRFKCAETKKYFNPKTGTIFENTKLPLKKWFTALFLILNHKKGISSVELGETINVTQGTAWYMIQRIQSCLKPREEKMEGIIESDETFVGGKNINRHKDKKAKYGKGRRFTDKYTVMGLFCHDTQEVRLVDMSSPNAREIIPAIYMNVKRGSKVYTDEWRAYSDLKLNYDHRIVSHAQGRYNDGGVCTNRIENTWRNFKRFLYGTHVKVSRKHLHRYCRSFEFRFNSRELDNYNRFISFFRHIGCNITYARLIE